MKPSAGAGTMITASVVLVPLVVVVERLWTLAPGPPVPAATGVHSIACTDIALPIYFRLVRTHGSVGVASQSHLRASIGVVLGMALLRESVTLRVGLKLSAAITGAALFNLHRRQMSERLSLISLMRTVVYVCKSFFRATTYGVGTKGAKRAA